MKEYNAVIKEIIQEAPSVKLFRLTFSELEQFNYLPGQFVMAGCSELKGETGLLIERAFSIASSPHQKDHLELCIKILEQGKFSDICRSLKKGDALTLKGPFGKFIIEARKPYVFFAGGTGIAPIMSMLRNFAHQQFPEKAVLFFTFRYPQDYLYKKELEKMAKTYKNFILIPTCTSQMISPWEGMKGRFTIEHIRENVSDPAKKYYAICGNNDFAQSIRSYLAELSVPKENIKTEAWG